MSLFGRAVRGAEAGAVAALGVAASFFVLDLIRFEPLATASALSGAALGPGGLQLDLTSVSGLIAGLSTAYRIAIFTGVHFLVFGLVGIVTAVVFDGGSRGGFKPIVVAAVLCTVAFSATVAGSGSVVALESLGPLAVVAVNAFAGVLLIGWLRLGDMPEPEPEVQPQADGRRGEEQAAGS